MAQHRISPNVVTTIRPLHALTGRDRKAVRRLSVAAGSAFRDVVPVFIPSGVPVAIMWQPVTGAQHYAVDIVRLSSANFDERLEFTTTVATALLTWAPRRSGTYRVQVRSFNGSVYSGYSRSDDPAAAELNGAQLGWWLQVYIAPVSGGGIR